MTHHAHQANHGRAGAGKALAWGMAALLCSGPVFAANVQVKVVGADGQPLSGAVVFLDSPQAARAVQPVVGAEMAQVQKAFAPGVLVVTKGSSVSFPNRDTVRHHVYSFSPTKTFELKLYSGTPANPVLFDRAGVAVLGCNIHDDMVGWVLVLETPHHAISPPSGTVTLADVPPGKYTLRVWHERMPVGQEAQARPLAVGAAGTTSASVQLKGLQP